MREVEAETQSLRMQLVEVLRDRELRDQQQEALEGDLLKAISQLQLAADQRSLLYRDLARVRAERDADVSTLKEAKRVVDEKLATLEIELKETKKAHKWPVCAMLCTQTTINHPVRSRRPRK